MDRYSTDQDLLDLTPVTIPGEHLTTLQTALTGDAMDDDICGDFLDGLFDVDDDDC